MLTHWNTWHLHVSKKMKMRTSPGNKFTAYKYDFLSYFLLISRYYTLMEKPKVKNCSESERLKAVAKWISDYALKFLRLS